MTPVSEIAQTDDVIHAIDGVEEAGDAGRINQRGGAHRRHDRRARPGEPRLVAAEDGLGELDQTPVSTRRQLSPRVRASIPRRKSDRCL
jgi:hypothetical protein